MTFSDFRIWKCLEIQYFCRCRWTLYSKSEPKLIRIQRIQCWSFNAHLGLENYCWNFTWIYSANIVSHPVLRVLCSSHLHKNPSIKKNSSHEGIPHNKTSKLLPASLACTFNFLILCNKKRAITAQNGRKTILYLISIFSKRNLSGILGVILLSLKANFWASGEWQGLPLIHDSWTFKHASRVFLRFPRVNQRRSACDIRQARKGLSAENKAISQRLNLVAINFFSRPSTTETSGVKERHRPGSVKCRTVPNVGRWNVRCFYRFSVSRWLVRLLALCGFLIRLLFRGSDVINGNSCSTLRALTDGIDWNRIRPVTQCWASSFHGRRFVIILDFVANRCWPTAYIPSYWQSSSLGKQKAIFSFSWRNNKREKMQ